MYTLKNYFLTAVLILMAVPAPAMQPLREKVYQLISVDMQAYRNELGIPKGATTQEIEDAYTAKMDGIQGEYDRVINSEEYSALDRQHRRDALRVHPDKHSDKSPEEKAILTEQFKKMQNDHDNAKNAPAKTRDDGISAAQIAHRNLTKYAFLIDVYIVGGIALGTAATIVGLVKAWQWYKEYSSPTEVLLEKMEAAATKAVTCVLNLEFDRYNPTKDTDSLYVQFDIDPLLKQLSSDAVRSKVKQAIIAFDKTLEATYEQCAWHYDDITAQELKKQNPQLVRTMQTKLEMVKEAFKLCRTDLRLDRSTFHNALEFVTKKSEKAPIATK